MFTQVRTFRNHDRQCDMVEYVHPSGLRHWHMQSTFPEMSFGLSVHTPPEDDTGTPHILEHLTLCGSQKYPVKDPFFAMSNRTLAHDMNAFTQQLLTCYHFATTHEKDFLNMSDLYADLVFNPLLRKEDFEQEGWRLEQTPQGPKMKGVVLNEMKGAYVSQPFDAIIGQMQALAPNTPLQYSYGGHPSAITALTYEKIKDFHSKHYTPENAVLVTAGQFDMEAFHQSIEAVLSRHQASYQPPQHLPIAPRAIAPSQLTQENGVGVLEVCGSDDSTYQMDWVYLRQAPQNAQEDLYDQMMHAVLFETPGNPLKKIAEKHGIRLSAGYTFDPLFNTLGKVALSIEASMLPSDRPELVSVLEQEIQDALQHMGQTSIPVAEWNAKVAGFKEDIAASLDKSPAREMLGFAENVLFGVPLERNTQNLPILERFHNKAPTASEVQNWLQGFVSEPVHRMRTKVNVHMPQVWETREQQLVEQLIIDGVQPQEPTLKNDFTNKEDVLPNLDLNTLSFDRTSPTPIFAPSTPSESAHTHVPAVSQKGSCTVLYDVSALSKDELVKLGMLIGLRNGAAGFSMDDWSKHLAQEEVSVSWGVKSEINEQRDPLMFVSCTGSSMLSSSGKIGDVMQKTLSSFQDFNESKWAYIFTQRLKHFQVSQDTRAQQRASLEVTAPYLKANALNLELFNRNEEQSEEWLKACSENPRMAYEEMVALFEKVQSQPMHVVSFGDEAFANQAHPLRSLAKASWDDLRQTPTVEASLPDLSSSGFYTTNQAVSQCARAFEGPRFTDPDFAGVKVAVELLKPWLHEEIREKGGAYGSSARTQSGLIQMGSFRDPHVHETFQVFDQAHQALKRMIEERSEPALQEAKLSILKDFFAPQTPLAKAVGVISDLFMNSSDEKLQKVMEQISQITWDDVAQASVWLDPDPLTMTSRAAVPKSFVHNPASLSAPPVRKS